MKSVWQRGVVGVGYGGGKAHFVIAQVKEANGQKGYFNIDVECGSQKNYGYLMRSGINGFEALVEEVEVEVEVADDASEQEKRFAGYGMKRMAYGHKYVEAFDVAVEKFGGNFCAKCMKRGERMKAYYAKQEMEQAA